MLSASGDPAGESARSSCPRWKIYATAAGLVLATLWAYANALQTPFVLDDVQSVTANPSIRRLADLRTVLTPDSGTTAGRPLLNLTFALNHAWSGEATWSYHLVNVALHAAAALALFGLVRRTLALPALRSRASRAALPLAAAIAVLWALHPLQTETVTYVSQRSEALAALGCLLVLYFLVRSVDAPHPAAWLAGSVVAALGGIACKEIVVTVPVVALLFDRAFLSPSFRGALARRGWYYATLAASWVLLAWLMTAFPIAGRGVGFSVGAGPLVYAASELRAVVHYLALAVWPFPLVFDYGPGGLGAGGLAGWSAGVIIVALVIATVLAWRRSPSLGFLPLAFFVLLAPTSSVVPVVLQPVAESRMYLPLAAVITGVVLVLHRAAFSRSRGAAAVLVAAVPLAMLTILRNGDYRDPVTLWRDTIAKVPANARAHNSLGTAYAAEGRTPEAMAEFSSALAIDPAYAPAQFNLGVKLLDAGRAAEAIPHLERALAVPNQRPQLLLYLGQALLEVERFEDAVSRLRESVRLEPASVEAQFALGNALGALRRYDEAADALRAAARLAPDQPRVLSNLATALLYAGRVDEAVAAYRRAAALSPNDASIQANLEQALALQARAARPAGGPN